MYGRNANGGLKTMTDHDNDVVLIVSERFERRLAEENGKLRVEMATEFGQVRSEMAHGFGQQRAEFVAECGKLRAEMIERNAELLKWGLLFGATQTAALAAVIALVR